MAILKLASDSYIKPGTMFIYLIFTSVCLSSSKWGNIIYSAVPTSPLPLSIPFFFYSTPLNNLYQNSSKVFSEVMTGWKHSFLGSVCYPLTFIELSFTSRPLFIINIIYVKITGEWWTPERAGSLFSLPARRKLILVQWQRFNTSRTLFFVPYRFYLIKKHFLDLIA